MASKRTRSIETKTGPRELGKRGYNPPPVTKVVRPPPSRPAPPPPRPSWPPPLGPNKRA